MPQLGGGRRKVLVSLASFFIAIAGFTVVYESIAHIRYYHWKSTFDNQGWFGKITTPSSNKILMWEYRPYGAFKEIQTNRFGFRESDQVTTNKPDRTYRIAFIGDSVTLGIGIQNHFIFVRLFEISVNRDRVGPQVQALNFSVDGYNTIQISEMLRSKVLPFVPDKVVYVLCLNDFDFSESSGRKIRYFKKPNSFLMERLDQVQRRLLNVSYYHYHFDKNREKVFREILSIKQLLDKKGISFQVVIAPILADAPLNNYPLLTIHQTIRGFLKHHKIESYDLLDCFQARKQPLKAYAYDIWHPNELGHRVIASALSRAVRPYHQIADQTQIP